MPLGLETSIAELNQAEGALQVVALLAVFGFIVWLVFFSGNGDFRSFVADLSPEKKKKKKVAPASVATRKETNKFLDAYSNDIKNWVSSLRRTRDEISSESSVLLEKYPPIENKKATTKKVTKKKPPSQRSAAKKTAKKATRTAVSKKKAKPATKKKLTKKPAPVKKRGTAKPAGARKVASKKRSR